MKEYFSPDYATARERFRAAASRAVGRVESIRLDAEGPRGEELTIDLARLGPSSADHLVLHVAGVHGVEGFAGSAIQLQLLDEMPLRSGASAILIHAVNPYGMAWLRRANESNVDLNRNFLAAGEEYRGSPDAYRKLNAFLNPRGRIDFSTVSALWKLMRHPFQDLKQAVLGGQYDYPKGLFFGGRRMEQSVDLLREWLRPEIRGASRIIAVDVHTGLGQYGEDSLLHGYVADPDRCEQLTQRFGDRVAALDRTGVACEVRGGLLEGLERELSGPDWTCVGQEFGSFGPLQMLKALRDENRLHHYGAKDEIDHPVKRRLLRAFCPEDDYWRRRVLERGREVFQQAVSL